MNQHEKQGGSASEENWISSPPIQDVFIHKILPILDSFDLLIANRGLSMLCEFIMKIVAKREDCLKRSVVESITSTVNDIQPLPATNTSITIIATWRKHNHSVELLRLPGDAPVGRLKLRESDPPLSMKFHGGNKYLMVIYPHKVTLIYVHLAGSGDQGAQEAYKLEEGPSYHWEVEPEWDNDSQYDDYHFRGPYCLYGSFSQERNISSSMLLSFEKVKNNEYLRFGVLESTAKWDISNVPLLSITGLEKFEAVEYGELMHFPQMELAGMPNKNSIGGETSKISHPPNKLFTVFLKMKGFRGPYSAVDISCGPTRILLKTGFLGSDAAYLINPTFEFGGPWLRRYATEDCQYGKLYHIEFVLLKSHICVARVQGGENTVVTLNLFKCANGSLASQVCMTVRQRADILKVLHAQEDRFAIVIYGADQGDCCSVSGWGIISLNDVGVSLIKLDAQLGASFYKTFAISPDGQLLCFVHLKDSSTNFCTVSIFFTATGNLFHRWDVPVILNNAEFHEWDWIAPQGSCGFKIDFDMKKDGTFTVSVQANNKETFLMFSKIFRTPAGHDLDFYNVKGNS